LAYTKEFVADTVVYWPARPNPAGQGAAGHPARTHGRLHRLHGRSGSV